MTFEKNYIEMYWKNGGTLPDIVIELKNKYCIDKEKVKDAIDKHLVCGCMTISGTYEESFCRKCSLLKELGL